MRYALAGLLLAGATLASVVATPTAAQVAGNPGDLHTPTVYTNQYHAQTYGYAPGYGGPFGFIAAPLAASVAISDVSGARCGVVQDFHGRYTALCGL
jgi:hypothetical protein